MNNVAYSIISFSAPSTDDSQTARQTAAYAWVSSDILQFLQYVEQCAERYYKCIYHISKLPKGAFRQLLSAKVKYDINRADCATVSLSVCVLS